MSYTIGYLDSRDEFVARDTAKSKTEAHKKARSLTRKHPSKPVMILNIRRRKSQGRGR
jgi:hypothetical protein